MKRSRATGWNPADGHFNRRDATADIGGASMRGFHAFRGLKPTATIVASRCAAGWGGHTHAAGTVSLPQIAERWVDG